MGETTRPDEGTRRTEEEDAAHDHLAGRPPTGDEAQAAERAAGDPNLSGDQAEVAEHYREMTERGVDQKGEGRID